MLICKQTINFTIQLNIRIFFQKLKKFVEMTSHSANSEVNLFRILDLPMNSVAEKVRKRCQELLLKLHPDKNGGKETSEYHQVRNSKLTIISLLNSGLRNKEQAQILKNRYLDH